MTRVDDLSPEKGPQLAVELGLSLDEYDQILKRLGRTPTITELYMYSLMWSEHCSYKHSRVHLRMFPTEGEHVLQGPGENAGVISVGEGWAVAFKMESHNSPSAIEPYEGAATGVGGCYRDIFAMGARPIAALSSLRFGTLDKPRQRYLTKGAVAGVGGYGNIFGSPGIGGEIKFDEAYEGNCLVNAMGIGLLREENLTRAQAHGVGNNVILMGLTTGRDGIGGASVLASQEFEVAAEDQRPTVQAGDPFTGKIVSEACLELLDKKLLVGLGDLGAAGLTSSASEMASRAEAGIEIDVSKVPVRKDDLEPFEIIVSESQERMLGVATPENTQKVLDVCKKWGVLATVVGKVTNTGNFVVKRGDEIHAEIPALSLTDEAPLYDPPKVRPAYIDELAAFDVASLKHPETQAELEEVFMGLLSSPNIASRNWIKKQLDTGVRLNTFAGPGGDAAVLRIGDTGEGKTSSRGIAAAVDCNSRYVYLNPYRGAQIALAECSRNVSCTGALPAGLTDCLNFGSPEKPEVYWTFVESIKGLAEACREFEVPVTGGNVSFYNESFGQAIYPTPTVGVVGVLEDVEKAIGIGFKDEGDTIILLGESLDELGGSEYLKVEHGVVAGEIPALDFELERRVQKAVRDGINAGLINAAHDCSEGGVSIALAEMAIAGRIGIDVELDDELSAVASLFSETQSRVVVGVSEEKTSVLCDALIEAGVPYSIIGEVGADRLRIAGKLDLDLEDVRAAFEDSLEMAICAS